MYILLHIRMIVTSTTTALMLAMSLLVAAGLTVVAVKVFADDTIVQASDQKIKPSNSGQINQAGDGDGDWFAEIDQGNNALNNHCQSSSGGLDIITAEC